MLDMHKLELMLEDVYYSQYDYNTALNLMRELHNIEQRKLDIEHNLDKLRYSMVADLALAIRQLEPGLNIAVTKGGCKIGYYGKSLMLNPDFTQDSWVANSTKERFLKEFLSKFKRELLLSNDLKITAKAVVDHFVSYFRTLGEEITDTGIILINECKSTLSGLVDLRCDIEKLSRKKQLPTRSSRY